MTDKYRYNEPLSISDYKKCLRQSYGYMSEQAIEDFIQDGFLKVMKYNPEMIGNPAYVWTAIQNAAYDSVKVSKTKMRLLTPEVMYSLKLDAKEAQTKVPNMDAKQELAQLTEFVEQRASAGQKELFRRCLETQDFEYDHNFQHLRNLIKRDFLSGRWNKNKKSTNGKWKQV